MKPVNFVILTTQRSGSTWMVDVLDSCIDTSVYGELFLPEKMKWHAGSSDFPQFYEARQGRRPLATFGYLRQLYHQPGHTGFKLMYSNLRTYPEIMLYLCLWRLPVVHLIRHNVLDIVLSAEMARANGQWHVTAVQTATPVRQVSLDPHTLLPRLRRLRKKTEVNRQWLRVCRMPHLEISYEDLLADPANFHQVYEFLGLAASSDEPQSAFSKIRTASYQDEIRNFAEIQAILAESEFAGLLKTGKG